MARAAPASAAYVLHRYDWSETSLILDLFTRDQGRLTVVAKGAKRPYSQLRPALLPFQRLNVSVSRPARDETAEIVTLRGAEWAGGGPMLSGAALFSGFYLNELLMKLVARNDPHPLLFDAYAATMPALAAGNDTLTQAALRAFELVLLREIGLLPQLDCFTATLQPVQAGERCWLRPETGVVLAAPGEPALDGAMLQRLQAALDRGAMADLQAACADGLAPLKAALRTLLHYHLGTSRLRTREVMIDAQQLVESPAQPRNAGPDTP
ncbi:DNA repair protein RecO [Ideonella sp.]|uniref:DNA repair protein RecO n=1 Tax=Ideonella sp. TaxID=1929293 RepID=UPI002B4A6590|nr:DNA repair protein RecO [Ideonella sp.]HJV69375.1 DNA repair protein RecO [Ideonella sp.]